MNSGAKKDKREEEKKYNENLLQLKNVTKYFGGLSAVLDFDMEIRRGELLALIGPNGAGKTTLFNLITGFLPVSRGDIFFSDENITRLKAHQVAQKGIVRSFQANVLFMDKTVRENMILAFHNRYKYRFFSELFNTKAYRSESREIEQKAEEVLGFFDLMSFSEQLAMNLTHGHQRMLGVAIAYATGPILLLLDEPVAGLNDEETIEMMALIKDIRDKGTTIFLVEHDMKAVMNNSDRIVVIDYGKKIAEGVPTEIANNEKVIEAYLGAEEIYA